MRTKVERNCKKVAEQKLSISLTSPKVVLNASDCARLLDGTGKTSVLLVEKKSKVVPATSRVLTRSSPASSSAFTTPSLSSGSLTSLPLSRSGSSATQTKLCKSYVSSAKNSKPAEGSDVADTERLGIANTHGSTVDQDKSMQTKAILKPPKKRRGNDKKFEDISPLAPIFKNGDALHPSISPNGILTGVSTLQKDSDVPSLISSSQGDISNKHSIEHLLQLQTLSSIPASNSQTLMVGSYSHDSRAQCDMSTSSFTILSLPLSASSTIPDNYQKKALHQVSELHIHGEHNPEPQDSLTFSSQSTNCKYFGKTRSREHTSSLPYPHPLSVSKIVTHSKCFHLLPEQVEPMNLSTCKPASELLPLQASTKIESQTPDDVSSVLKSHQSQPKDVKLTLDASASNISEMSQQTEGKQVIVKQLENDHLDMPQAISLPASLSSDLQRMNPPVHSGVTSLESHVTEYSEISKQSDSPVDSHILTETVLLPHNNQAEVQHGEARIPILVEQSTPGLSPSSSQSSHVATLNTSLPQTSSLADSQVIDITRHRYDSQAPSAEPLRTGERELPLRAKRPKKRVEVPMDAVSCADRLHRYSLTINDVVANFIFAPEPLEEFLLTEEEEAAIRDQFESVRDSSSQVVDVNASQFKSDTTVLVGHTVQAATQNENDIPSVSSDTFKSVSPQKCLIVANADSQTVDQCQNMQSAVKNIDNVLAFVAGDVFNTSPPVSSCGKGLDNNTRKRIVGKLKKTGEVKDNGKGSKILKTENVFNNSDSLCNTDSIKELSSANEKLDISTSCDENAADVTTFILKSKKAKKKKSNFEVAAIIQSSVPDQSLGIVQSTLVKSPTVVKSSTLAQSPTLVQSLVQSPIVAQMSTLTDTIDEVLLNTKIVTVTKKKRIEGKFKFSKKRKSDNKQKVLSVDTLTSPARLSADKETVGSHRAETSDIGESIASTSGGSEQDTPVHEPESKDELISSHPQAADRENHDTGLESGEDDNKPVRRYKKRLDFVKCDHCDHQARGRSALSRHMKKVHMLDVHMPYKCQHCEYGCTKMASLNRHLFTHGVYPCSRCSFVATERIILTQHIMEQHKDKLNMKLCKMCNRYIKCEQITIEQHVQECQGPTPYKCTECDKVFRYSSSLRVHYHTHFPNQPKRFGCEQCHYRTNYKANLHKHHKNMHASRDRDVQCPDCGKLFSTEDNMRRHKKVHTMIRPFACETCEKTFKTAGALKGHQLIHTATRPYTCNFPECNRSFRTPKFMKSHQEEFHRLVPKKFFCTVEGCNYSFFKRSHLKRHAITHTGERNYHCTWPSCNKSFRHADNLKVHFRSHTNEKPVQCHLCDFKCKQKNSLFWHKKKIHQVIDMLAYPKRMVHKLKVVADNASEAAAVAVSAEAGAGGGQASPELRLSTPAYVPRNVESTAEDPLVPSTHENKPVSCEHSVATQTVIHEEQGPLDLYEFKSDDESAEEAPGHFRRDKTVMNVLTPLPPPPKELLQRIEIEEMKEKEKKEKADRIEQEKKEKVERKEQEKKEREEKKKIEKKEKAEKRELEKREKIRQKELEKKEISEKKMLEKIEKIEKMELEKKEKELKKEQERKEKMEKKEQERREKIEKKEQEKKEKAERKELELKEKPEKKSGVKKSGRDVKSKVTVEEEVTSEKTAVKSSTQYLRRKKLSAATDDSVTCTERLKRSKKKFKTDDSDMSKSEVDEHITKENEDLDASVSKRKKVGTKRFGESTSESTGSDSKEVAVLQKGSQEKGKKKGSQERGKKKGRFIPPKRKPSARIKARRAATAGNTNAARKDLHTSKAGVKKKCSRKKAVLKPREMKEAKQENKTVVETRTDDDQSVMKLEENEVPLKSNQEETLVPPIRPSSPAYSEEIMVQGKASPYRDFSDAEDLEDDETEEETKIDSPSSSHSQVYPTCHKADDKSEAEVDLQSFEKIDNCIIDRHISHPSEEYSDNEVSNDIPLTPPRAPAPPPVESSEDEMEPEPEQTPFSVPGPNTPFSVHGPHTPFSVPPPTNLMQQHSVHSEETPMPALASVPSMEMHSQGSVDMQQSLGSVEMHPRGSVEMSHPHGSVEMNHSHGSVEMSHPHGSVEMHHPHGSVEMSHPHGSVEVRSHNSVEMRSHGSVEMAQPLGSVEIQHSHRSVSEYSEQNLSSMRTPESVIRESNSSSLSEKYDLPQSLHEQAQASDADKEYFDQYLKSLSAANNRAASGGLGHSPSGLQQLEAMVCKSHLDSREMCSRSPISSLPISVITSLESTLSLLPHSDLHSRMDSLVSDRHHESLYVRDTASSLPRLPDRQTPLSTNHPCSTPSFDAFSALNPLHPVAASGGRESSYLRQPDKLFQTPPSTSSFMAEAMFQRQAMTTPFLPPQSSDKSSLTRIPDATPLRSSSSSSLLRRPATVQDPDMFSPATMSRAVPRHPFANPWASQEVRPAHWQTPYLPRQPNMATTGSFFQTKDNYLMGRNFMFDPSVRPAAERNMFPTLSATQTQDSFPLDRFDLSNYFPNAMTYGSSSGSLSYSRSAHSTTPKPFDDRFRQTASAAISDYRGLPPTGGSTDMFSTLPGVNTGFNIYPGNPMSYHAQHMTDNVNSAFLSHPTTAQHAMFERDYAAAAVHRGLYSQNTPYSFIDERQYPSASKLGHTQSVPPTPVLQERDIMSRSSATDSQMQDPYRSMLYRY